MGGMGGEFGGGSSLCTGIPGGRVGCYWDGLVGCVTSAMSDGALWAWCALNGRARHNRAGRQH